MNSLLALAVLFVWGMVAAHGNIWDLQRMITKATGRAAVLHYSFYGCHCGWGGRGGRQGSWCSQLSCECDRSLALCLRRSLDSYRARYRFYPKHKCR
nr:PREDICTED: phospholipase A2, membrane associated-like [Struthio camelus australis]